MAELRRSGAQVRVLIVTDGAGEEPEPESRRRIARQRCAESRAALAVLGGAEVELLGLPDRGLSSRAGELREALARVILADTPELVFVPSPAEIHPDHRAVAEAFLDLAVRPPRGLARALQGITAAFYELSQPIRPNFLLDVTAVADLKDQAMAAFASQNGQRDYPGFIRGLNAYRRMTLGPEVRAAEGYYVLSAVEVASVGLDTLRRRIGPSEAIPVARRRERTLARRLLGLARRRGP